MPGCTLDRLNQEVNKWMPFIHNKNNLLSIWIRGKTIHGRSRKIIAASKSSSVVQTSSALVPRFYESPKWTGPEADNGNVPWDGISCSLRITRYVLFSPSGYISFEFMIPAIACLAASELDFRYICIIYFIVTCFNLGVSKINWV